MIKTCPHCKREIDSSIAREHIRACFFENKGNFLIEKEGILDEAVQIREAEKEINRWMSKYKQERGIDSGVFFNENLTMLNRKQLNAVEHVIRCAQEVSEKAKIRVLERMVSFGYRPEDLEKVKLYLRDKAPLLIHINLKRVLGHLLADDHYRNLHEINGSNGHRLMVENGLFGDHYEGTTPFERVKYGVLNILNDPKGVGSCYGYGDSYLILKNVRMRTSFTNADTFSVIKNIASCEHYLHVLNEFNDVELRSVLKVALGESPFLRSTGLAMGTYKEVQYHGPVRLYHDVECLVANTKYRRNPGIVKQLRDFELKFDVPVFWMDEYEKFLST